MSIELKIYSSSPRYEKKKKKLGIIEESRYLRINAALMTW
jgi:hypothetical protein